MELLVFRHGIAEDDSPDGSDAARRLTEEGVERTERVAVGLNRISPRPDVIITSPKVRAKQTAQIAGDVFEREPIEQDVLADENPTGVINMLRKRDEQTVMIVGHEPTLSTIIEILCTTERPRSFVKLRKAGCALVEVDLDERGLAGRGVLQWLLTPKALRRLAKS